MSKYVDTSAIVQVIGCVYNNPQLLEITDKYTVTEEDFVEDFHKIVFGSIFKIYELGATKINLSNIIDFLSTRPKSEAIFKKNNGEEWLIRVSESAVLSSFDYYYNRMKKMTLLRAYNNYGIDVSFIYDPDNIFDTKKKQEQEDFLDNSSLEEIANLIDTKIEDIKSHYINEISQDSVQASDGIEDLLKRLQTTPEVGVPLYGPLINTVTRGARLKKLYLRSAPSGVGKAIPNYIIIPTPNGKKRVDEIKINDLLFGPDGKPTKVLATYPQPEEKDIWLVELEDGRTAECCEDHLWNYYYKEYGCYIGKTASIKEIYEFSVAAHKNIYIENTEPVIYNEKEYDFHPYNLGAAIKNHFDDVESEKIIEDYLNGSVEQRQWLLYGLFGSRFQEAAKIKSKKICDAIVEICYSLGITVMAKFISAESCYYVMAEQERKRYIKIIDISPTKRKTKMTCFTVDNKQHEFLMNDYCVTHNTRTMLADVCYIGCDKIYDSTFGWIKNGTAEPVLYITTEQEKDEIQTLMLAFLAEVNEEHILNGQYVGDESDRVIEAVNVLKNSNIFIEELPDFSLMDVENVIRKNIREHNIKYVCFDYIMTSLKILEEISRRSGGVKLREDNILFMLSRRLKDLANEYGIFIMSGTQVNGSWKDDPLPDQNLLRGAKSIADSADLGMILLPVNEEDLQSLDTILAQNVFDKPNLKISVYKNRRGRWKGVFLWCKADLGTCRVKPMFCTDWSYELQSMEDLKIITDETSAF